MMRVQWLVGEWSGTGWSEMGPDKRKNLIPTAIVQSKLDGLLLVFELQARNEDSSTSPIAMGFLSYDEQARNYRWNAFTAEGRHINTEAKVETDTLQWTIQRPEGGEIRYTIKHNDKDEWFEVGEMRNDGDWHKFFEMTLQRQK